MNRAVRKTEMDMTEGPLIGKIIRFALPLVATGLLQVLYNASDMVVVGNFSPAGSFSMGAVGACGALINLIVNLFMGLAVGVGICVAQAIGAKRYDDVHKLVHTAFSASLICGIGVGIVGFTLAEPLLLLMGTPQTVLVEAVPYMRAYFVGAPAMLVYNFMAAALRSSGDSKRPLIFLAVSGLLNVITNVIMVVGFGLGAVGVGIATTVAQYASMIMIIVYMSRMSGVCKFNIRRASIDKKQLAMIIRNGLPAGIQSTVFSISNVLIQSTVNSYGDVVVAGNAAAGNIEGFVWVAMNAMHQSTLTVVGQNMGARKIDRIKKAAFISLACVAVIGLVMGLSIFAFHEPLLSIYEPGNTAHNIAVREAGARRMAVISTTYFLCGIMDVLTGVLRGMGRSTLPMLTSIFTTCVLRIAWIFTICPLFPKDIGVLYMSYPATWVISIAAHLACCIVIYKKEKRRFAAELTASIE
jgi:putative MATE family efflux protein